MYPPAHVHNIMHCLHACINLTQELFKEYAYSCSDVKWPVSPSSSYVSMLRDNRVIVLEGNWLLAFDKLFRTLDDLVPLLCTELVNQLDIITSSLDNN